MKTLLLSVATGICLMLSQEAQAVKHTITVSDFSFAPSTLTVQVGDTVQWVRLNGDHTTTSQSIPSGAAPWDSPITAAMPGFSYVPAVAGAYNYICTPHMSMGMVGNFTAVGPNKVQDMSAVSVSVGPNPADARIWIQSEANIEEVAAVDLSGKVALLPMIDQTGAGYSYSVAHLAEGLYVIRVMSREGLAARRILVSH